MFSLLDEPWIPVLDTSGAQREVSLLELFAQAHRLRMVACELPTQDFAILRLLLAIMHRATGGPPDEAAWRGLWRDPALPQDIHDYLQQFGHRFDLLHPEQPFYQVAGLRTASGEPFGLERIIADVPPRIPYLTSRTGEGLKSVSPAEAARWVVHCQAYDPAGIKTGAVGDPRVREGKVFPLGVAAAGWLGGLYIEGRTLKETLLLNLIPEGIIKHNELDTPVWERDAPHGPVEEKEELKGPYGVVGLYTWQSRRIRLYGDRNGITGAMVSYGDILEWQDHHLLEPLSVWGRSTAREKKLNRAVVYLPSTHDHTRALWRGLESLLPQHASSNSGAPQRLSPRVMEWLAHLSVSGVVGNDFTVSSRAVGMAYGSKQAVIDQIYGDALTMNVHVVREDSELRVCVVSAVADADEAVKALTRLAADLVRAGGGSGSDAENGPKARASEVAYARLDRHFRDWLARLRPGCDPVAEREAWQRGVSRTVARLGQELIQAAGPTAWVGRIGKDRHNNEIHISSSQAEAWFRSQLRRALPLAAAASTRTREEATA
jgi:CRISPR system Cascade subunit CasA